MQYSNFDSIGRKISKLGFGLMRLPKIEGSEKVDKEAASELIDLAYKSGVNYFDTAYTYHDGDSEKFVKYALSKYPRESFCLASKLPAWIMKERNLTAEEIFNDQLQKCGVDYFDFYLIHSVIRDNYKYYEEHNCYEILKKKKAEGKIRHLGFSFHGDYDLFLYMLDNYQWDFVQLQINYYDWKASKAKDFYKQLEKRNIPCIVMEPVRGGSLQTLNNEAVAVFKELGDSSPASYALRFVSELPQVLVTLSGMSDMTQVKDNINTFSELKKLTEKEKSAIEKANVLFRKNFAVPCTDCKYCIETCPKGVNIPLCFKAFNEYNKTRDIEDFNKVYDIIPKDKRADNCIKCGVCMKHCPQGIKIPDNLNKVKNLSEGANYED